MELSNRLETIASFVTEGYVVADIGTDHGYIPIYLTSNGNCPRAYAMDVNKEPLSRAKTHIEEENAGEVVSCILSEDYAATMAAVRAVARYLTAFVAHDENQNNS